MNNGKRHPINRLKSYITLEVILHTVNCQTELFRQVSDIRVNSKADMSTQGIQTRGRSSSQSPEQDMKSLLEQIKLSLQKLTDTVLDLKTNSDKNNSFVSNLVKAVSELQVKIEDRDKRILYLEEKLNDIEQYQKKDNIIILGPAKLHSYRNMAESENNRPSMEDEINEEQAAIQEKNMPILEENIMKMNFITFAKSKLQIDVKEEQIVAIHNLHTRKDGTKPVLVKLANSATKFSIMSNGRKLKKTKIFINDHLTRRNSEIEKKAMGNEQSRHDSE